MAQESSQRRTETVKPGGMSKEDHGKLIKNCVRLAAELPTTDIADYLKQNQILTKELFLSSLKSQMNRLTVSAMTHHNQSTPRSSSVKKIPAELSFTLNITMVVIGCFFLYPAF
jgi:hypothetical protein